jgi:para-nitrobenzyl esterase
MTLLRIAALAAALALAPAALAQSPPPPAQEVGAAQLALAVIPAKNNARLTVTSPAFRAGADIPFVNTQYHGNLFPGLEWTAGPVGTKSYVIVLQDADILVRGAPVLHWTAFNIEGTKLDPAMTALPAGASNGPNITGLNKPYWGPRTPAGPKHRYHFQVFALDALLPSTPPPSWEGLVNAMKDHVLASGELIGLGQIDPSAPPPAPRPTPTATGTPQSN